MNIKSEAAITLRISPRLPLFISPPPPPLWRQRPPWEAVISRAHPEELMTSNVPVNAEKAEHPS